MNLEEAVDTLFDIENRVHDIIDRYDKNDGGLKNDAIIVISTIQELRFIIEEELGV